MADDVFAGVGVAVRLEEATAGAERLVTADPGPLPGLGATPRAVHADVPRLLALGVATVDAERAAGSLGGLVTWLPDDMALGARAARPVVARVVLLEPVTEGRLAATLARAGEGPAALYLEVPPEGLDRATARLRERGATTVAGVGPLGSQLLVRAGPTWGPHLVLVVARTVG